MLSVSVTITEWSVIGFFSELSFNVKPVEKAERVSAEHKTSGKSFSY